MRTAEFAETVEFLRKIDPMLLHYVGTFHRHHIDKHALLALGAYFSFWLALRFSLPDENRLADLGIPTGHRLRVVRAIARYKESHGQ